MKSLVDVVLLSLAMGCTNCAGPGYNRSDASAGVHEPYVQVRARDPLPHPYLYGRMMEPKWVRAFPVAKGYLIAPAPAFGPLCNNFSLDPAVLLKDGGIVPKYGRLVNCHEDGAALIRADVDAPLVPIDSLIGARGFLDQYFSSWGRSVKPKPKY